MVGSELASKVSSSKRYAFKENIFQLPKKAQNIDKKFRVIAYDYGVKKNILRILFSMGCDVEVVPAKTSAKNILSKNPDGIFLSNGPGDPEPCDYAIKSI